MKTSKKIISGTIITASMLLLAACSGKSASSAGAKSYDRSISWMTTSELESLDPATAGDTASEEQIANTYEGLFRLGKNPDYWDKKRVKLDEISYSVQKPRQPTTTSTKAASWTRPCLIPRRPSS